MWSAAAGDASGVVASLVDVSKRYAVRRKLREAIVRPRARTWAYVLQGVSCEVRAGEFFGLLGPNGAGKTTLLKILATLILPDEGVARVSGLDVVREAGAVRACVSPCLASERSLYWRLTAVENLRLAADLQGLPVAEIGERVREVLGAVGLHDTGAKMVGQFSSGMMQRLLIARALLSRPALLLLDEPTRSLDPLSAREFRRFLREELVQRRGCAVLLATHSADEAFELCDRVAILDRGRLLAQGGATALADQYLGARYRVLTPRPDHPAITALVSSPDSRVELVSRGEDDGLPSLTIRLHEGHAAPAEVLSTLVRAGAPIVRFERVPLALADLIEGVLSVRRTAATERAS